MPSLSESRAELSRGDLSLSSICNSYVRWVSSKKYMVLDSVSYEYVRFFDHVNKKSGVYCNPHLVESFAVECSKRGNDVYRERVDSRFTAFCRQIPNTVFFETHQFIKKTRALFLTLTYDTKICSFVDAWLRIGAEFNRFMARLRKKYGRVSIVRVFEAFENGHPHIHCVAIFEDFEFDVELRREFRNGKWRDFWRPVKEENLEMSQEEYDINEMWHSRVDVQCMPSLSDGISYLRKYLTKCIDFSNSDSKGVKTLALLWLFRKRSFSISGTFLYRLHALIQLMHNSNLDLSQVTLDGEVVKESGFKLLGFVPESVLCGHSESYFVLSDGERSEVVRYLDEFKR